MSSIVVPALIAAAALLGILLFPLDLLRGRPAPVRPDGRVDERDVMFARMSRRTGTPEYEEYYSRRPELKKGDDRIRALIPLMKPGALHYDPEISGEAERYFEEIFQIEVDRSLAEEWGRRLKESGNPARTVREMLQEFGAVAVGFTALREEYVYTHKGRFEYDYGSEIRLEHPSAIVFLVEMDFEEMQRAPGAEIIRESARQYYRAAVISKTLEAVLRAAGHDAKSHHDAHYDVILPPLAVEAGLGEVGRHNILVADRFGTRVRIGAVTTDLPLDYDRPLHLGVDHFCTLCKKCAENCPSRALSMEEKVVVRGVPKWPTGVEQCYSYWRKVGSDCGICMAVCPFSHRNNLFHNLVRRMIPLNPWIRRIALFFDDLIYGRVWK